jgi:hypothetical protein
MNVAHFRNKRKNINIVTITLLFGAWFSLVCQNCIAHISHVDASTDISIGSHCENNTFHDPLNSDTNESHDSDFDTCDCSYLVSNHKTSTQLGLKVSVDYENTPISNTLDKTFIVTTRYSYSYNHSPPDCSLLTPIDTFCIQIK